MRDSQYAIRLSYLLEDIADFFYFSEPPFKNESLARRAGELRWDVKDFIEKVLEEQRDEQ